MDLPEAQMVSLVPYAYDVHTITHSHSHVVVTPKSLVSLNWRIGPVTQKTASPSPTPTPQSESHAESLAESEFTVQLTADQQVALSISGEDKYDNPVPVTGDVAWWSSDEAIVQVFRNVDDNTKAIAVAVGPVGTAAITVTNDVNQDGTGDFQGSLAIDVVAGEIAEIIVGEGEISAKPAPDQGLPPTEPGTPDQGLPTPPPGVDNTLPVPPGTEVSPPRPPRPDQGLPGSGARPDNSLPGSQPGVDNTLPGQPGRPDNSLPGSQPGPDQGLPGGPPARPDQGLPGSQPGPDQGLPGSGGAPDQGLPPTSPGAPDQGLPGGPPARPDQGLPGGPDQSLPGGPPARPDQGLPDAPEPKGRRK